MPDDEVNSLLAAMERGYAGQIGGLEDWAEFLNHAILPSLRETDRVDIAIPTNIELEADPAPPAQLAKVKPTGPVVLGLAACLGDRAVLGWMEGKRRINYGSATIPYDTIRAVNDVTYTYKMNKMPGHEVLAEQRWPLLYMDPFKFEVEMIAPWRKLLAGRLRGELEPVWSDATTVSRWE